MKDKLDKGIKNYFQNEIEKRDVPRLNLNLIKPKKQNRIKQWFIKHKSDLFCYGFIVLLTVIYFSTFNNPAPMGHKIMDKDWSAIASDFNKNIEVFIEHFIKKEG